MAWTKGDIVQRALEELGIASYIFDLQADELNSCLNRLDSMIAMWELKGLTIGYNLPSAPNVSVPTDASGLADTYIEPVAACLALRIAPMWGKQPLPQTYRTAKDGYSMLLVNIIGIPQMARPSTMPVGAGNKPTLGQSEYFTETDPLSTTNNNLTV